jgi:hypothetical protein
MKKGIMLALAFVAGYAVHSVMPEPTAEAQSAAASAGAGRVFELRTYTSPDGKREELSNRFRDHTIALFKKHGMESIAYFIPQDAPGKDNQLIYLIAHKDRASAAKNWAEFLADDEWKKVTAETEANGRLIAGAPQTIYLDPTSYSPLK